jgi:lipopolysaccharide assembly protein A
MRDRDDVEGGGRRGVTVGPRQVVAVVILVLALIFLVQNTEEARIEVLWADVDAPLWVALLVAFAAGLVVGGLMARTRRR